MSQRGHEKIVYAPLWLLLGRLPCHGMADHPWIAANSLCSEPPKPPPNVAMLQGADELHADAMGDFIAMAFECDVTRVISYMLEDERSEFTYGHVEQRAFPAQGSSPKGRSCHEYHTAQHDGGDVFATITGCNIGKVASFAESSIHRGGAGRQRARQLRGVLGRVYARRKSRRHAAARRARWRGKSRLEADQHLVLEKRPLRDLYFTLLNDVYELASKSSAKI